MNIKHLLLSLLVLCVMAISCRKDTYRNEVNTKEEKATIKSYRSYFYNVVRKQQQAAVMKGNILSSGSKDIKVYPNWEKATLSETDKYELLEVPIFHGNEGFLLYNFEKKGKKSTVIDETVVHSVFKRLVMHKNKAGVLNERILTYIPDKTYLEKNGPDISHNRINRLDKNFSGYIEYSDINKNRLFVLLLKDGKAVFKKQFRNEKVTKGKSAGVMDYWICDEECYDYWEWQCVGPADDPSSGDCTDPEITDSWCEPVYCDDGLGGGGGEEEDPCLDPANMNTGWCDDDDDGGGGNPPPCGYSYKKGVRVANDCDIPPKTSTADRQLPNSNKLPPNGTTDTQVAQTCVFKTMEWISKYYGGNETVNTIMEGYRIMKGYSQGDLLLVIVRDGVPSADLVGLISLFFENSASTNLFISINSGYPMMATISDGAGGGHEVMVTGYNFNGTIEYFDPLTGLYNSSKFPGEFSHVRQITGIKP